MITTTTYTGIIMMIAFGVILPTSAVIWWVKTRKEKFATVLVGALGFFIFATILESIPKAFLFSPTTQLGQTVMNNAVLFTLIAALLAGVFEETGRFVMFKTLLKKQRNKETAISYGIGHGGFEALYLLVVSGIQLLVFSFMIKNGTFQTIIDQIAVQGVDTASIEAIPASLAAITPLTSCLSLIERISAMIAHVGFSIFVFYAVKKSKTHLYILAIILHALFDVPAALYQFGIITNVYLIEALFFVLAVALLVIPYKLLYKKDIDINENLQEE